MSKYNYLDKHEIFHLFSKSPVRENQTLGQAVNKAGHTVLTKEIIADDIPWFPVFGRNVAFKETKGATLGVDLLKITGAGAGIYRRNNIPYPENDILEDGTKLIATNFLTYLWEKIDLTSEDNHLIKNKDGKLVLIYHSNVPLTYLDAALNSQQGSENTAARVWIGIDKTGETLDATRLVEQFIAPTDCIVNGFPSIGYALTVSTDTETLNEEVAEDSSEGYFANNFTGTIYFNANYETVNPKISFFEYVGDTVKDVITDFDERITALEESGGGTGGGSTYAQGEHIEITTDGDTGVETISVISDGVIEENNAGLVTGGTVYNAIAALSNEGGAIDALNTRVTDAENAITTLNGDGEGSVKATAKSYADAAQAAAEATAATALTDAKTELEGKITDAQNAADKAQGEIDDLEDIVGKKAETTENPDGELVDVEATGLFKYIDDKSSTWQSALTNHINDDLDKDDILHVTAEEKASWNALETVVGDSTSGLVKAVADNAAAIANKASQSDLDILTGRVTDAEGNITTLQTAVTTTLPESIADAKKAGTDAQDAVTALEGRVTTAEGEIDDLEELVGSPAGTTTEASGVFATIESLSARIDAIKGFSIVNVKELPEPSADCVGKIYLKSKTSSEQPDVHEEYICIESDGDYSWELIGSTEISLDGYVTDGELSSHTGNGDIHVTAEQKASWTTGAETAAKNTVAITTLTQTVTDNKEAADATQSALTNHIGDGTHLTETQKAAIVSIATKANANDLTAHTGNGDIHVTAEEKTSWTTGAKTAESNAEEIDTIKNAIFDDDGNSKVVVYEAGSNVEFAEGENGTKIINVTISSDEPIVSGVQSVDVSSDSHEALTVSDTTANPKIKLNVNGEVTSGNTGIVTGGTVYTAIENSKVTISAKNADNYYGSSLLSVENKETVTIVANPTSTWEYDRTTNDFSDVTSVEDDMLFKYDSESDTNKHVASIDGQNLINGSSMFSNSAIESFVSDMPKLKNGTNMFNGCANLKIFQGEITRLTNGAGMFSGCTSLTTFCGDLASLTDGADMFKGCQLDEESVEIICDTLPVLDGTQTNGGTITIGGSSNSADIIKYIETTANNKKWTITYNENTYSPSTQE